MKHIIAIIFAAFGVFLYVDGSSDWGWLIFLALLLAAPEAKQQTNEEK